MQRDIPRGGWARQLRQPFRRRERIRAGKVRSERTCRQFLSSFFLPVETPARNDRVERARDEERGALLGFVKVETDDAERFPRPDRPDRDARCLRVPVQSCRIDDRHPRPCPRIAVSAYHNLMVWSAPAVATTSPPPAFLAHLAHQIASECPCSPSGLVGGAFGAGGSVDELGAGSPTSDRM